MYINVKIHDLEIQNLCLYCVGQFKSIVMNWIYFIIGSILVSAVSTAPNVAAFSRCSLDCKHGSNDKFNYEVGYEYIYGYTTETRIGYEILDEGNLGKIKTTATVILRPISHCDYVLLLRDVQMHNTEDSEIFANEVSKRSLQFSFENGKIENICGSSDEPIWVVNFKRGILSHIQNSMNSLKEEKWEILTETDISGTCESSYVLLKNGTETVIDRRKIPSECSQSVKRPQKFSMFGYSINSLARGLPLITSQQKCKQQISDGILKEVKCLETHNFNKAFKAQKSSVQTEVSSTLTFKDVQPNYSRHSELLNMRFQFQFEDEEITENGDATLKIVQNILEKLNRQTQNGVSKDAPLLFSELVSSLSTLSYTQIMMLCKESEQRILKFIIDALILVKNDASTQSLAYLFSIFQLPEEKSEAWFTSLAFVSNPSLEMISSLLPVIKISKPNKAMLGISSLIYNYCLKDDQCELRTEIKIPLQYIKSRLGSRCQASTNSEKLEILFALKAIGNIGRIATLDAVLKRCYYESNEMEIKIAAINAWRKVPCSLSSRHFLDNFADQMQDDEIRIASYIASMNCPTPEYYEILNDRLTSESVNPVTSYVWSHLHNVRKRNIIEHQWMENLIENDFLVQKFSSDFLRLIRDYKTDFPSIQEINVTFNGNNIFTRKSPIPRSSMLNFTIEMFGESINLFELGGRIEGLELYIEQFFGPNGYYPEETIETIIKNLREKSLSTENNMHNLIPGKSESPLGSFYLKMLGNEIHYQNLDLMQMNRSDLYSSNLFDMIMELFGKGNVDIIKNFNLIDSKFTYSTIIGFPLKMQINGTATLGFNLKSKFDFQNRGSVNLNAKLHPSAAVNTQSQIYVDAIFSKSGIKILNSYHSSSEFEIKSTLEKGKLVDIELKVPQENIELFEGTSESFILGNEKKQYMVKYATIDKMCIPIAKNSFYPEMCIETQIPNNTFTNYDLTENLTLPRVTNLPKVKFYINKNDKVSSFIFRYHNKHNKKLFVTLDIKGNDFEKRWTASYKNDGNKFEIDLHSPFYSLNNLFFCKIEKNRLYWWNIVKLNNVRMYDAKFNLERDLESTIKKIKTQLIVAGPEIDKIIIDYDKEITWSDDNGFIRILMTSKGDFMQNFKLYLGLNSKNGNVEFDFNSNPLDANLSGSFVCISTERLLKLEGSYRYLNQIRNVRANISYDADKIAENIIKIDLSDTPNAENKFVPIYQQFITQKYRFKRSHDAQIMSDSQYVSIAAGFNSFNLKISSPYRKAENVYFEIIKKPSGWATTYKRNKNKTYFHFNVEYINKKVKISVDANIPEWELLFIFGGIDFHQTVPYIIGEKESNNVRIEGSGTFGHKSGLLNIQIHTLVKNYKDIIIKFEYNILRNMVRFNSSSIDSDFKILFEINKGLSLDILIPNENQNTILNGKFTPFNGDFKVSSRFPFLESFNIKYKLGLGSILKCDLSVELNNLKILEFIFEKNAKTKTTHLMFSKRIGDNHSKVHFHLEDWKSMEFSFTEDKNEFKITMNGSEGLPEKGLITYEIKNTFGILPKTTINGDLTIDKSSTPKEINLSVKRLGRVFLNANLKYNFDLDNMKKGNFVLKINQTSKIAFPYDNISGSWDFEDEKKTVTLLNVGSKEYKLVGQIGLYETDLEVHSDYFAKQSVFLKWRYNRVQKKNDHFLKIGIEDRYVMLKIKGIIEDIYNLDVVCALNISKYMENDLEFRMKWNNNKNVTNGSGDFKYGKHNGTYNLISFERNYIERSAKVHLEATSNIVNFSNIKFAGEVNLSKKLIEIKMSWDTNKFLIKGSFSDSLFGENVLDIQIPGMKTGKIRTLYDFKNPLKTSLAAIIFVGNNRAGSSIKWERNENFSKIDLEMSIQSTHFGDAILKTGYDLTNINDAKGSLTLTIGKDSLIESKWTRIQTAYDLKDEFYLTSMLYYTANIRTYLHANWKNGLYINSEIQLNDKIIQIKMEVGPNKATASLLVPYKNFSDININIDYDIKEKLKKINFNYVRGGQKINGNLEITRQSLERGSLLFTLSSSFQALRDIKLEAKWKSGKLQAVYSRNGIVFKTEGTATINKGDNNFDFSFTLPSGKYVHIYFSHALQDFVLGKGGEAKDILHMKFSIEDQILELKAKGSRTEDTLYVDLDVKSSFGEINTFYIKLDSELNLNKREVIFELKANEFYLDIKNYIERRDKGFYIRSHIKSSLLTLSKLIIGFGRDMDAYIVTYGHGLEKEITLTVNGKEHFRKGFYGTYNVPFYGIEARKYSIDYEFESDDELSIKLSIERNEGNYIRADALFNSTGIKSRLISL